MKIVYLGYNSFFKHKRGVENVIEFQSKAYKWDSIYYLCWDDKTAVSKYKHFICISIKHNLLWPLILNIILWKLKHKGNVVIHSHNPLFTFFSVLSTNIFTVHDGLFYLKKSKKERLKWLFYIIEKVVYQRSKHVHFISNFTKKQTLFGKRKNFVIIPNTSHLEQASLKYIGCNDLKIDLNMILIVRSIEERARIDLVLEVAQKIGSSSSMKFVVAGKGPLLDHYRQKIVEKRITNVELLGYVDDESLLKLYASCKFVMVPAEYGEGFGLPIIEGYLFNKPVIASNRCAIPEVIISDTFLFENNSDSIVHSINYVSEKSFFHYREYYDRHFSNQVVLFNFQKLYLEA